MIFGWLRPEEEPENAHLVEISTDQGDHVVVNAKDGNEAESIEDIALDAGAEFDSDEQDAFNPKRAGLRYKIRDHETMHVRSEPVIDPDEDLEPDTDKEPDV